MQVKAQFFLLFVYFMHFFLLFVILSHIKVTKRKFLLKLYCIKTVFKTKDKRDIKEQNITLILLLITK